MQERSLPKKEKNTSSFDNQYDVIISGMGGAGLFAAWEVAINNEGIKTLIISDRPDRFVVENIISINQNINYIRRMYNYAKTKNIYNPKHDEEDRKFFDEFKDGRAAIKSITRYVKRRLDELKESGAPIDYVYESFITEVDTENASVTIASTGTKSESKQTHFTYLVGAEGNKRHTHTLISNNISAVAQTMQFDKEAPLPHVRHFTAYLIAEKEDETEFLPTDEIDIFNSDSLKEEQDGDKYKNYTLSNPGSLKKTGNRQIKFSLTGELPDRLYYIDDGETKNREIFNYACEIVKERWAKAHPDGSMISVKRVGIGKRNKYQGIKEKNKISTFITDISEVTQAAIEISDNDNQHCYYVLIGDAVRNANYQKASGMHSAMYHAHWFGLLVKRKISINTYNALVKLHSSKYRLPALPVSSDINLQNAEGYTPLYIAAAEGRSDCVFDLLDKGADPNIASHSGGTALMIAIQNKHFDIVLALLDNKADVNQANKMGNSPLHIAANYGCLDEAKELLDKGANINHTNDHFYTPLLLAITHGHTELAITLINRRADLNPSKPIPTSSLHIAAHKGHLDITNVLLEKGAMINSVNINNVTPLFLAAQEGHFQIAKLLIAYQADISITATLTIEDLKKFSQRRGEAVHLRMNKLIQEKLTKNSSLWSSLWVSDKTTIPINAIEIAQVMGHDDIAEYLIKSTSKPKVSIQRYKGE